LIVSITQRLVYSGAVIPLHVDVDVAKPIARKTTVWEVLGLIPCSADGFSCENIWGWIFLEINFSLLSDNGYKCILTYNQKCYLICLLYNCVHWFHFQLIKSTCNLRIWIKIYYYYIKRFQYYLLIYLTHRHLNTNSNCKYRKNCTKHFCTKNVVHRRKSIIYVCDLALKDNALFMPPPKICGSIQTWFPLRTELMYSYRND